MALTIAQLDDYLRKPEIRAFLDTIAYAEGTTDIGYRDYFAHALKLDLTKPHPRTVIKRGGYSSSAAGRYQAIRDTWADFVRAYPSLSVMSPQNQDRFAVYRLGFRQAIAPLLAGNFELALNGGDPTPGKKAGAYKGAAYEWASMPPNRYGQGNRTLSSLKTYYANALAVYRRGGGSSGGTPVGNNPPNVVTPTPKPDKPSLASAGIVLVAIGIAAFVALK